MSKKMCQLSVGKNSTIFLLILMLFLINSEDHFFFQFFCGECLSSITDLLPKITKELEIRPYKNPTQKNRKSLILKINLKLFLNDFFESKSLKYSMFFEILIFFIIFQLTKFHFLKNNT